MPAPIKALFAVELGLAVVHLINPPVPVWAERGGATRYLWDLDAEANVPTWFASVQLALIAVLLALLAFAWRERSRLETAALAVAGAAVAALSLDELVGIHEKLGRGLEELLGGRESTAFDATGPWVAVAAPLFLLLFAVAAHLLRRVYHGRHRATRLCLGGTALFFVSFAGIELIANFLPGGDDDTVLFEETGEMAGATLFLWGLAELMDSHGVRLSTAMQAPDQSEQLDASRPT